MGQTELPIRITRAIQLPLVAASLTSRVGVEDPKGAVYTKRWVVELLLDLAGYVSDANLVDCAAVEPAAGEGAFLAVMIERLARSCQRLGRPISDCSSSLLAYELDEASASRARILASQVLVNNGINLVTADTLAKSWIRTGDYLFESAALQVDFAIGNPPYVRLEEIPEDAAQLYRQAYPTMCGRADLYVGFFEAALGQLKPGGVCAFICADRWMRNQYGGELRELITSHFAVDVLIEMHNANAFQDEVDAYPAITVIRRQRQGATVVASAGSQVEHLPPGTLASTLLRNADAKNTSLPAGLSAARVDTWFNGSDPWPCQSPAQLSLLRRIENQFPPLEANARIGIGVATGNDRVFVTKNPKLVESSRLLKLAMAKDIGTGTMQWSGHYLVDPWNGAGLVNLEDFPKLRAYFEEHETALRKRHTATKSVHAWFKTIDRVTHAIALKPKLYVADIKNFLDPVLDRGETYPHHNLYFIQSEVWNLEVLGGLLLSAIGQFFVASYGVRMRGGYFRFQAQYLRRIRVPDPKSIHESQQDALVRAFRTRNRSLATDTALKIYRIDRNDFQSSIGS